MKRITSSLKATSDLVLLIIFAGLLAIPTLTVLNLTPTKMVQKAGLREEPRILGVENDGKSSEKSGEEEEQSDDKGNNKEEELLVPVETPADVQISPSAPTSELFTTAKIDQKEPNVYLIKTEIEPRTSGNYRTEFFTLLNSSTQTQQITVTPYQVGDSANTKVLVTFGTHNFELFDQEGRPYNPTAQLQPNQTLKVGLVLESLRDVNFSETLILRLSVE